MESSKTSEWNARVEDTTYSKEDTDEEQLLVAKDAEHVAMHEDLQLPNERIRKCGFVVHVDGGLWWLSFNCESLLVLINRICLFSLYFHKN